MEYSLLEKFIREAIREQLDEPKGGPFGKVLFAPERTDKVEPEENTEQEEELLRSLVGHYEDGDPEELEKFFPWLGKFVKKGKYSKFLKAPENKKVYRVLALGEYQLKTQMGIKPKQIPKNEGVIVGSGTLKLGPALIQSWTLKKDPKFLGNILGDATGVNTIKTGEALVVVSANTSNGKFYFNPEFAKKVKPLSRFYGEQEVISYDKVPYDKAFVYLVESEDKDASEIIAKNKAKLKEL